jgi:uncharacterized protein YbbK (DUF523 family)
LFSACLAGRQCGYDGSSYGEHPLALQIIRMRNVHPVLFCPEHFSFGTPRALCDIHGGNGFDVLDGRARVLTDGGEDWTAPMVAAAEQMLQLALFQKVRLAVLMDISAACGSQVIYSGSRRAEKPVYQIGAGVCAALLIRNGIPVVSQRDYYTLGLLMQKLDATFVPDPTAIDHHLNPWYREYFGTTTQHLL